MSKDILKLKTFLIPYKLGTRGQRIYNNNHEKWNRHDDDETIWNYGDLFPDFIMMEHSSDQEKIYSM